MGGWWHLILQLFWPFWIVVFIILMLVSYT